MNTLNREALETVVEEDGWVAVVRVREADILHQGTRSESVIIDAEVFATIYGQLDDKVSIWRYTSDGDVLLLTDRYYVVALTSVRRVSPSLALLSFVEVSPDSISAVVNRHRETLEPILRERRERERSGPGA